MSKIIIGIHGLANKPPKDYIEACWKKALVEGLQKNNQIQNPSFSFQLVYWADLLYKYPLHQDANFHFDSLYDNWPYAEANPDDLKEYQEGILDEIQRVASQLAGDAWDDLRLRFGMSELVAKVIQKRFRDLHFYYDEDRKIANRDGQLERASTVLKNELKAALQAEKGKQIMLIAHSMGSIIAYDVLYDLVQNEPDLQISHLVTVGSPLGLTPVKAEIIEQWGEAKTPALVTRSWVNFADKRDIVATDEHLADDYGPNSQGIQVKDDLIANDYKRPLDGEPDYHKIYGYLRAPEVSKHLKSFLD